LGHKDVTTTMIYTHVMNKHGKTLAVKVARTWARLYQQMRIALLND
jgi:site-specific recombinase XerD